MNRLSKPLSAIQPVYQVVVIGSGYGGAIAASRMARTGQSVCLLEKGKEFLPGEFPDSPLSAMPELQVHAASKYKFLGNKNGLFNFHFDKDISVLTGCGLGGTSLINANVSLLPTEEVLKNEKWPEVLRKNSHYLKEGVRLAQSVLKPQPYPAGKKGYPVLPKTEALKNASTAVSGNFQLPPINVNFEKQINDFGVLQEACNNCGNCVTGCNTGAKNTTQMNYLPDAHRNGAEIYTCIDVQYIKKTASGKWQVYYHALKEGREVFGSELMFVEAEMIFLAAGTLGSTEIMLRSQAQGLPLSEKLGEYFTGNGDILGFGYDSDQTLQGIGTSKKQPDPVEAAGPCITGAIDLRKQESDGMIIEEGVIPSALGPIMAFVFSFFSRKGNSKISDRSFFKKLRSEMASWISGSAKGVMQRTQTYLLMTHEDGTGKLRLKKDKLQITWPGVGSQTFTQKAHDTLKTASDKINSQFIPNPVWSSTETHNLITVHPLGGCSMGESVEEGVVNAFGEVFDSSTPGKLHNGLYICDGSIIPCSLGTNPLLTISGLSEMIAQQAAENKGWTIDYALAPLTLEEAKQQAAGVQFTERMTGYLSEMAEATTYTTAWKKGKKDRKSSQFILTVQGHDIDELTKKEEHLAGIVGTVTIPSLSKAPLIATESQFQLFVRKPEGQKGRHMLYKLKLKSIEGKSYYFHGFKDVRRNSIFSIFNLWRDTTTLFVNIHEGDQNGKVLMKGILKIKPIDFLKQLLTFKTLKTTSFVRAFATIGQFLIYFTSSLVQVYLTRDKVAKAINLAIVKQEQSNKDIANK